MNETYTNEKLMSSSKVKPLLVTPEEINEIVRREASMQMRDSITHKMIHSSTSPKVSPLLTPVNLSPALTLKSSAALSLLGTQSTQISTIKSHQLPFSGSTPQSKLDQDLEKKCKRFRMQILEYEIDEEEEEKLEHQELKAKKAQKECHNKK